MAGWIIRVGLLLISVGSLTYLWYIQNWLDSQEKPDPKVYLSDQKSNKKKILLLYHDSRHSTMSKRVGFMVKILNEQGYDVYTDHPNIKLDYNPMDYDVLVFACPVYLGNYSKAFNKYIEAHPFVSKKVLILLMGMDSEDKRELDKFEEAIPNNNSIYKFKIDSKDEKMLAKYLRKKTKF